MPLIVRFLPVGIFVGLFVGSGLYFTLAGVDKAFYQLSPLAAILPALGLGWILYQGDTAQRMQAFLDGVRHRDIITMCIIFLLAGAFSEVTRAIGSVDATVHLALSWVPAPYLLMGLFLIAAFIATAIGTSMGTIATIAPIAAGLSTTGALDPALAMATVVGGAMFGDNLSLISDTTIAAVMSQEANMREKLKLNARVAGMAAVVTLGILWTQGNTTVALAPQTYDFILVTPYLLLIALAVCGVNVFVALVISLVYAGGLGGWTSGISPLALSQHVTKGFASMYDIMLLSMLVGGLSGLSAHGVTALAARLSRWIDRHGSQRMAQLVMAKIVSLFDVLLANNTIAIIFSGELARTLAKKHAIAPHRSAAWLDIFSCVFQGILPYGAQILLASTIAGISPLSIVPHVSYCYILGVVAVGYIVLCPGKEEKKGTNQL